jgi:hypothetical protein
MRWELGCVVLYYFNNNSNIMAHKDDDNFIMVSRIGTVEYRFQINFHAESNRVIHSLLHGVFRVRRRANFNMGYMEIIANTIKTYYRCNCTNWNRFGPSPSML